MRPSNLVANSESQKKVRFLVFIFLFAFALMAMLLWMLDVPTSLAEDAVTVGGNTYYVTSVGSGTACSQGSPCDIYEALSQAVSGDNVYVAGGTYNLGTTLVITQDITLSGGFDEGDWTASPDPDTNVTAFDGGTAVRVIHIQADASPIIEGFSIRNGVGDMGAGIYNNGVGSPIIRGNRIHNNQVTILPRYGGGIFDGGFALIEKNEIYANQANQGGGIYVLNNGSSQSRIEFNEIYNNITSGSSPSGGGVALGTSGDLLVEGNEIHGNTAAFGGGFYGVFGLVTIQNNWFYQNTSTDVGGGLYLRGSSDIFNNTIVANTATNEGAGVYVEAISASQFQITNTIVASNTGAINDGIHINDGGGVVVGGYNNIFNDSTNATFTNAIVGDPRFISFATLNLHLRSNSPNVDTGATIASVTIDIDEEARPNDAGYEVGADERYPDTADFDFDPLSPGGLVTGGTSITYDYRITNTGTALDSYDFSCGRDNPNWTIVTCPATISNIPPGNAATVQAVVQSPVGPPLDLNRTFVTATSQFAPVLSKTVMIASQVRPLPGLLFTENTSTTLLPNEVMTFTHHLTNTGNSADIFTIKLVGGNWGELLPTNAFSLALGLGESREIEVRITVPPDAPAGLPDVTVIRARSFYDPSVFADVATEVIAKPTIGTRYVTVSGDDQDNNCTQRNRPCETVAHAVGQASFSDEVLIAQGTFLETTTIDVPSTMYVRGGWNSNFTSQQGPGTTIIDMANSQPAFLIETGSSNQPIISNLTIANGQSGSSGGAIFVENLARPQFNRLIVRQSQGTRGGAMYVSPGAQVTIRKTKFITNTAINDGGAIYLDGATLFVRQSAFRGNQVLNTGAGTFSGGAIYVSGGLVQSDNNLFFANTAASHGGAWAVADGQVTLGNNTFTDNAATNNGGAFYNIDGDVQIFNTIVANSNGAGAAVFQSAAGAGSIGMDYNDYWNNTPGDANVPTGPNSITADPNFLDNQYRLSLGSPAIDRGGFTTLDVDFEDDFRPSDQGYDIGYDEVTGCRAKRANVIYGSIQAAVDVTSPDTLILVTGICRGVNTITANNETISQTVHILKDITIQGGWNGDFSNYTGQSTYVDPEGRGRGLYISGTVNVRIEDLIVVNGDATGLGGGPAGEDAGGNIYILDSQVVFSQTSVVTGTAVLGGGFYNHMGDILISAVPESRAGERGMVANTAVLGGGLYNYDGQMAINRAQIKNNTASDAGGGIYNASDVFSMTNSVLYQNTATNEGGGVYNEAFTTYLLHLSVVDNTATNGGGLFNVNNSDAVIRSTLFQDNQASSGPDIFIGTPFDQVPDIDYNYYYPNATPVVGGSPGPNSIASTTIPPGLTDILNGDFHLVDDAPAADVGDPNSPVKMDFEGDPRPSNQGPDIGADEIAGCLVSVNGVIYGSLQEAIDAAAPGDTILVSGICKGVHTYDTGGGGGSACGGDTGTINTLIHLTKNVRLEGGWNETFTNRNEVTTLDARQLGKVIYIGGPGITATVDGFDIINGLETGPNGNGAGICIENEAQPTIINNRIYSHTATHGGAIYSHNSTSRLDSNRIYTSTATADGAGVYLYHALPIPVSTVQNNFIYANTAVNGGAFYNEQGSNNFWHNTVVNNTATTGGGAYVETGSPQIRSNIFADNVATTGGGVFGQSGSTPVLDYNDFFSNSGGAVGGTASTGPNTLAVNPQFKNVTPTDFTIYITSPVADQGDPALPLTLDYEEDIRPSHQGFDMGADEVGGCYARVVSAPTIIYGSPQQAVDAASDGDTVQVDGICYGVNNRLAGGTIPVNQNLFLDKSVIIDGDWNYQSPMTATLDALTNGRVVYVASGESVTVTNIVLRQGDAAGAGLGDSGGGVFNDGTLWLNLVEMHNNTADQGGGVTNEGVLTLRDSRLYANTAVDGGAFYNNVAGAGVSNILSNRIYGNQAADDGGAVYQNTGVLFLNANRLYNNLALSQGGGVYLTGGTGDTLDVWNNFIYNNIASTGGGLFNNNTNGRVWHNTFVTNDNGNVYSAGANPDIRSNIIDGFNSSHGFGINIAGGSPLIDYNNVVNNSPNYVGTTAGANDISVSPLFISRAEDDYHLQDDSPGADIADSSLVDVTDDIDGDIRPTNGGPDMGADEINSCLIRVIDPVNSTPMIFGVLQDAITFAEGFAPNLPDVEIARGECRGVKLDPVSNTTLQVGYIQEDLVFRGSLRRSDFGDPNDRYNLGAVTSVINGTGDGRVLYIAPGAHPSFSDLAFVGGDAAMAGDANANGGGIYNPGPSFGPLRTNFSETSICDNTAQNGGGFYGGSTSIADFTGQRIGRCVTIRVTEGPNGEVEGTDLTSHDANSATNNGGGLYSDGVFDVRNASFYENTAGNHGGGVFNSGTGNRLINATFYQNVAQAEGGGIYNSGDDFRIYHNTIRDNTAVTGSGGGIRNTGTGFVLNSSIIYENTSAASGGGLSSAGGALGYDNFYVNVPDDTSSGNVGNNPVVGPPGLLGIRTLSQHSRNIDQADPALLDPGVPPDSLSINYDYQLDTRPDGNPNHTQIHGYGSDVGADEYYKDFGCDVIPTPQERTTFPGTVVTYTFNVRNVGHPYPPGENEVTHGYTDTLAISLASSTNGWAVLVGGQMTVTVGWQRNVTASVQVTVPPTATAAVENSVLRCRSLSMPSRTDTGVARTLVGLVSAVQVDPDYVAAALPGDVLTFTHYITNIGNLTDEFLIAANGGAQGHSAADLIDDSGQIVFSPTVVLSPGQSITTRLRVTIFDNATGGDIATPGLTVRTVPVQTPPVQDSAIDRISIGYISGTRYVAVSGVDNTNCTDFNFPCATIQHAVDQALDGDAILVAGGLYTGTLTQTVGAQVYEQMVLVDKSVSIMGGYNTADNYAAPAPITNAVRLDAEGTHRVFYLADGITVTLSGLFIQNGVALNDPQPQFGGGIYNVGANLTLSGTWVLSNAAQFGGGLYHITGTLKLYNSVFAHNANVPNSANDFGEGGGLYIRDGGPVVLKHNTFVDNVANTISSVANAAPPSNTGNGGAVYQNNGDLTLFDNIFAQNVGETGSAVFISQTVTVNNDYNLYFENLPAPATNFITGTNSLEGDPDFVDGFYHIGPDSAAKDTGVAVGVSVDFELASRPQPMGGLYDIGADERRQNANFTFLPISQTQTIDPNQTWVYNHILTNIGDFPADYTITMTNQSIPPGGGWSYTLTPANTGTLNSNESAVVTFTITAGSIGGYVDVTNLIATSSLGPSRMVTDTTIISSTPGVDIEPPGVGAGVPNMVVSYTHILTNTGDGIDEFFLRVITNTANPPGWTVTMAPTMTGYLLPGETMTFTVDVLIPVGTPVGTVHTVGIMAEALAPYASDILTETTTVLEGYGLLLTPDNASTATPGSLVTYMHTLQNLGNVTDTITLAIGPSATSPSWTVTVLPTSVTLPPLASQTIDVTVDVPAGASPGMQHVAIVTATSSSPVPLWVTALNTTTITGTPPVASVVIEPDNQGTADPGQTIQYQHTVTNTGTTVDSFSLSVSSDQGWVVSVTPTSIPNLGPGGTQAVTVSVTVPGGASSTTTDVTTVRVESDTTPSNFDTATDTTQVGQMQGVMLVPNHTRTVSAGTVVNYMHTLTNLGNGTEDFNMTATSSRGWPTQVASPISVNAGASVSVTVVLTVPIGASGLTDVMPVTAVSAADPTVSAMVTNTTIVSGTPAVLGVDIEPDNSAMGAPGTPIVYQHIVTNTGDTTDDFVFSGVSSQGWTISVLPASARLDPGQVTTVQVIVNIPAGAAGGTVDVSTIRAASLSDPTVFDTATDTTTVEGTGPSTPVIYLPIVYRTDAPVTPPTPTPTPTSVPPPPPTFTPTPPTPCTPTGIDLIVTNIQVAPNPPASGQPATVSLTILNQGGTNVPYGNNFYLDFYVDRVPAPLMPGDIEFGIQGSDMQSGVPRTYSAPYTFAAGSHVLYAQVDTDNTVNECPREDNNVLGPIVLTVTGIVQDEAEEAIPVQRPPNEVPRQTPTPGPDIAGEGITPTPSPTVTVSPTATSTPFKPKLTATPTWPPTKP